MENAIWVKPLLINLDVKSTQNKIAGSVVDGCNPISYDNQGNSQQCS